MRKVKNITDTIRELLKPRLIFVKKKTYIFLNPCQFRDYDLIKRNHRIDIDFYDKNKKKGLVVEFWMGDDRGREDSPLGDVIRKEVGGIKQPLINTRKFLNSKILQGTFEFAPSDSANLDHLKAVGQSDTAREHPLLKNGRKRILVVNVSKHSNTLRKCIKARLESKKKNKGSLSVSEIFS